MFLALYANENQELLEHSGIAMLGRTGTNWVEPEELEMIPLPRGASLVTVPYYIPVGLDGDRLTYFESDPSARGQKAYAVAALLPQGFTRTLLPACVSSRSAGDLPLLGYAAVGFKNGQVYTAAVQTDEHRKWHPVYYNTARLPERINRQLRKYPDNRILQHLAHCSLDYSCFTAQNIFYRRWEGGIPTMPSCNADCIGCISESHHGADSPQQRLTFVPDAQEIAEIAGDHLQNAKEAIISFGQGCEGEPALNAPRLAEAIKMVRQQTDRGTININTNAGFSSGLSQLYDAGLDSMRVTIFSFAEDNYVKYHRPRNYKFASVRDSIAHARAKGVNVSINLLVFPGFTDRESEIEALLEFIRKNPVDMIQLRNLNIDPDYLLDLFDSQEAGMGMLTFLSILQQELPQVRIGSYTHPLRCDKRE